MELSHGFMPANSDFPPKASGVTIFALSEWMRTVIQIRQLPEGRFEVFAEGLHSETFEGCLGAVAAAHALAGALAEETGSSVVIVSPWGVREVSVPWTIEESDSTERGARV